MRSNPAVLLFSPLLFMVTIRCHFSNCGQFSFIYINPISMQFSNILCLFPFQSFNIIEIPEISFHSIVFYFTKWSWILAMPKWSFKWQRPIMGWVEINDGFSTVYGTRKKWIMERKKNNQTIRCYKIYVDAWSESIGLYILLSDVHFLRSQFISPEKCV